MFQEASRPVKIVVIGSLCVLATAETIFYYNVAHRYLFPAEGEKASEQKLSRVLDEEYRKHKLFGGLWSRVRGSGSGSGNEGSAS